MSAPVLTSTPPPVPAPPPPRPGAVVAVARWSATHRWTTVLLWLALVAATVALGSGVGTRELTAAQSGTGGSGRADVVLDAAGFPDPLVEQVLVRARAGQPLGAGGAAAVADVGEALAGVEGVAAVGDAVPSADGTALLVPVTLSSDEDGPARDAALAVARAVEGVQGDHPDLRVASAGSASLDATLGEQLDEDYERAELLTLPVTLVILVVAFGALLAAGVPVLLGLTSVATALGLTALVSHVLPVDPSTSSVVLLMGMAVGVDYALFFVRRAREERSRGAHPRDAVELAAATSGRAVVTSGLAVVISMAGMYLAGSPVFTSFATGTILVIAVAVLGSVTVLPAVLALLGGAIDRPRLPLLGRDRGGREDSRTWSAVVRVVLARPVLSLLAGAVALLALAAPALGMRTALPGLDGLPRDSAVVRTLDAIAGAYPQEGTTDEVAVWRADGGALDAAAVRAAVGDLHAELVDDGTTASPAAPEVEVSPDGTVARFAVVRSGAADTDAARAALADLREEVLPATVDALPGVSTAVTGATAWDVDFGQKLTDRMPLVVAFVLGLTVVVLTLAFRSLAVALTAVVLTLLSVGAAYGAMVAVFQGSWAEGLLGFESTGSITSWIPLFLFVVLFGLSMDYHVFVVSRIREGVVAGLPLHEAIATGVSRSAGVVTSAAVVMVAVFSIFATLSLLEFKQLGVGLAVAVLLDATVVRGVLLPAAMAVLGERTWWLPRWLRWLPQPSH